MHEVRGFRLGSLRRALVSELVQLEQDALRAEISRCAQGKFKKRRSEHKNTHEDLKVA